MLAKFLVHEADTSYSTNRDKNQHQIIDQTIWFKASVLVVIHMRIYRVGMRNERDNPAILKANFYRL